MERRFYQEKIAQQLRVHPLCAILGPRQVGKTTLARAYADRETIGPVTTFDLENPLDLVRLENPLLALKDTGPGLVVIDEIQRRPDLFPVLRVLVDRPESKKKFLILGSASRDLIKQSSETLAGRIGYIELPPFTLRETKDSEKLWIRGGFPRSYLAKHDEDSMLWRRDYITTFLERDIPGLGFSVPAPLLRRFWLMLAHYHGQIVNASEIGRSLAITHHTVQRYIDILAGTFMIRVLRPWFENISKRQVKSFKLYFKDSGILHALLGIELKEQLLTYPRLGAFWEGFALEEVIRTLDVAEEECFFWSTQAEAELDLLILKKGKKIGFEFKYMDAPKVTKSMRIALQDLKLDQLIVVYPGNAVFSLDEHITAYGLETIAQGTFYSL